MATVAELFETMEYGPAPESDTPARSWLASHNATFGHFIGGAWTKPGKTFDVIDPSTARRLAKVTQGTTQDVDAAVNAARKAYPAWSRLTPHARARFLYALARMVQRNSRLFAVLETLDKAAVSYQVVLTKADELKPSALERRMAETAEKIAKRAAAFPVILPTSSRTGLGIPELRAGIARLLEERAPR